MPKREQARQKRVEAKAKITEAEKISAAAAEDGGRDLSEDEDRQYNSLLDEAEELNDEAEKLDAEASADERRERRERIAAAVAVERDDQPSGQSIAPRVNAVRNRLEDDPKTGFRSFVDFCSAVREVAVGGRQMCDGLKILAAEGMSQGSGADGGFLVPPTYRSEIWTMMFNDEESLASLCTAIPVQGQFVEYPAPDQTTMANGVQAGGVRAYWHGEAEQITDSKVKLRQIRLEPQELSVLVYVTGKLLRDSPMTVDAMIRMAAADAIKFKINESIMAGTGVGQPLGILNSGSVATVAKESGQSADTIVAANINKMWSRVLAPCRRNAVWIINQDTEPQLQDVAADVGTGGAVLFYPAGGISATPYDILKGRRIVVSQHAETLGDKGDITLADLSKYHLGLRPGANGDGGGIREDVSMHLRFDYAETAFRFMFEADGQPALDSTITQSKGANTLSWAANLAARA
jgi:HK97 family phage major capsid protein